MRSPRTTAVLSGLALAATTALASSPIASAAPGNAPDRDRATQGRGPEMRSDAARRGTAPAARPGRSDSATAPGLEMPDSYPHQPRLRVYDEAPDDAADEAGLVSHADLAPQLQEWMARSDRLSVQTVGQSSGGRDLYLATVTAPETREETARQSAWREKIRTDPEAAAADAELQREYKTPLWISANIHGNEWEGTDAAMNTIGDLIDAPDAEVADLLESHRIYFSLSLNPDGRTVATRATRLGLDPNRDMITNATPEATSFVRTAQAIQPLYVADFHGYTGVLQVEPCGPPHGENYEYDLFLPHAYQMAKAVERDVVDADIEGNTYYDVEKGEVVEENTGPATDHIKIPYRDTASGWDDYPPIFTAQYAAYYGASTSTVELPLERAGEDGRQTPENARVNVAVAEQTMTSMIDYFDTAADDMLDNQIEAFRRGVAGEPKQAMTAETLDEVEGPEDWKEHWDVADDQDPVELPRAYVIPAGDGQRSASDARRVVEQLLQHSIEVGVLERAATIDGVSYPAGSYVVDMHQPLRGLANALLDLGSDISKKVPSMYDVSAWSYSYTWGATVEKAGEVTDPTLPETRPITTPESNAAAPAGARWVTLDLAGVADYRAVNDLLERDAPVTLLQDGSALVGPFAPGRLKQIAREHDVAFERADAADRADAEDGRELDDLTIAYSGTQDDQLSLLELGFDDLVPVNSDTVADDPSAVTDADVLWVGRDLELTGEALTEVQDWVDAGHSVVGRGEAAFEVAETVGLVSGSAQSAPWSANGIVEIATPEGSPMAPYAQESAFVYPPTWFTDLGEGTTAALRYAEEDPFLAGHWADDGSGQGPQDAAGEAAAVSAEADSGARALVFGTSVFFRTHPKGGLSQAARGIFWAG